jgi:eukaryotic-like serine/threonine-protein kinase
MIRFFRFASVMLMLILLAMVSAVTTMHFAIHGAEVTVPNFKGMPLMEAERQSAGLGLNLNVENRYYSSEVPVGSILSQSPTPGTVVRREWNVRVAESLGPQKVSIPDVVGTQDRAAALELRKVGLELSTTAHMPYAGFAPGTVIAQDPPAHGKDVERPSVSLLVVVPPTEENTSGFVMPDFTGQSVTMAATALSQQGIKVDSPNWIDVGVSEVGKGDAPIQPIQVPGTVLSQTPAAGSFVSSATVVEFSAVH